MKIYDLIVIGDGLASKAFLYELSKTVKKSQNFTIAKVFSEKIAPSCSLRTTSTVSLTGIEEGVSPLGDLLSKSFYSFKDFLQSENPEGIYPTKQIVAANQQLKIEKIEKRFKSLQEIENSFFKSLLKGVELSSYIVAPIELFSWYENKTVLDNVDVIEDFMKNYEEKDGLIHCSFHSGETIVGKKIVLCTGAYSKLFANYYDRYEDIEHSKIVAGSFLYKKINLGTDSLYFTINDHNFVYRNQSHELIIGSTTVNGAITAPLVDELKDIFYLFKECLNIDLGDFTEYEIITGLRHKARKRMPFCKFLNESKTIYMINGLYKNGFSLPFYFSKKAISDLFF